MEIPDRFARIIRDSNLRQIWPKLSKKNVPLCKGDTIAFKGAFGGDNLSRPAFDILQPNLIV